MQGDFAIPQPTIGVFIKSHPSIRGIPLDFIVLPLTLFRTTLPPCSQVMISSSMTGCRYEMPVLTIVSSKALSSGAI